MNTEVEKEISFGPFINGIQDFLEHYEMVFRISKDDEVNSLVITPCPKTENGTVFCPIRVTGTWEEIVSIMDDPESGIQRLMKDINSLELTPIDRVKKTRKKRTSKADQAPDPANVAPPLEPKTPVENVQEVKPKNDPKETEPDPDPEEVVPKPTSIVPDEPPAKVPGAVISQPPPQTDKPKTPVNSVFNTSKDADSNNDLFEKYRKLSQDITLEIRGLAPDWREVGQMWKDLMTIYRSMDLKVQGDFKGRLKSLHESIMAAQEAAKKFMEEQEQKKNNEQTQEQNQDAN